MKSADYHDNLKPMESLAITYQVPRLSKNPEAPQGWTLKKGADQPKPPIFHLNVTTWSETWMRGCSLKSLEPLEPGIVMGWVSLILSFAHDSHILVFSCFLGWSTTRDRVPLYQPSASGNFQVLTPLMS